MTTQGTSEAACAEAERLYNPNPNAPSGAPPGWLIERDAFVAGAEYGAREAAAKYEDVLEDIRIEMADYKSAPSAKQEIVLRIIARTFEGGEE